MSDLKDITVCFCTRNRIGDLTNAIVSLDNTSCFNFPIVVIEDCADQKFRDTKLSSRNSLNIIEIPRRSCMSFMWNLSIISTNTKYVLICNDDIIFLRGWVDLIIKDISDGADISILNNYSCFLLDKKTILTIGYFDERFSSGGFEDIDHIMRYDHYKMSGGIDRRTNYTESYKLVNHLQRDSRITWDTRDSYEFLYKKWSGPKPTMNWFGHLFVKNLPEIDWYPAYTEYIRNRWSS